MLRELCVYFFFFLVSLSTVPMSSLKIKYSQHHNSIIQFISPLRLLLHSYGSEIKATRMELTHNKNWSLSGHVELDPGWLGAEPLLLPYYYIKP